MKPPLMAICSRSSTTRAPGWLFTTPSWFAPQAWPPPLILPHTHFSQGQSVCYTVCLCLCISTCTYYVCELVYLFVNVWMTQHTVGVKESVADQSVLYCACVCAVECEWEDVRLCVCFIAIHCQNIYCPWIYVWNAWHNKVSSHFYWKATCRPRMINFHTCICNLLVNNWSNKQINWIRAQ